MMKIFGKVHLTQNMIQELQSFKKQGSFHAILYRLTLFITVRNQMIMASVVLVAIALAAQEIITHVERDEYGAGSRGDA